LLAATIGRRSEAERHFTDAIEMNERMGARPYLAHSLREYAELLRSSDSTPDRERAAGVLERAESLYLELEMPTFAEQTRALRGAGGQEPGAAG
jgi:hypothetical protein